MRLPDVRLLHRRARRFARWTGSIAYRSIVVPLLDREETEHALDLACRLAADRGARVVLVAPLVVERELPLNAHIDGELAGLKERLESRGRRRRARTASPCGARSSARGRGASARTSRASPPSAAPSSSSSARRSSRGAASTARSRARCSCSSATRPAA